MNVEVLCNPLYGVQDSEVHIRAAVGFCEGVHGHVSVSVYDRVSPLI